MTANQINYAKHLENVRHNVVSEAVEQERNQVSRYAAGASYAAVNESRRHNQEMEGINWYTAQNTAQLQGVQAEVAQYGAQTQRISALQGGVANRARLMQAEAAQGQVDVAQQRNYVTALGQLWQHIDNQTRNQIASDTLTRDYLNDAFSVGAGLITSRMGGVIYAP